MTRWLEPLLLGAVFLGALDQTVVAAILPQLALELRIPIGRLDDVAWAVTSYLAGYAFVLPVAGHIADRRGWRWLILAALGLFALGSGGIVLFSSNLRLFIANRALQGIGAGALLPIALGRAFSSGDLQATARRVGLITAVAEGGALLGPLYGAGAIQLLDWRWVFWINVPVALLLAAGLARASPLLDRVRQGSIDVVGAALLGTFLSSLSLALSRDGARLLAGLGRPLLGALAILAVTALALRERRSPTGLLDERLIRRPAFSAALSTNLFGGAAFVFPLVIVPIWGNTLLGRTPAEAAFLLARLTLAIPLGALIGVPLGPRIAPRWVAATGMLGVATALALMAQWSVDIRESAMTPALLLAGLGFGLMLTPTNAAGLVSAGAKQGSTAASLLQSARLLGMALASAGLASHGLDRFAELMAQLPLAEPQTYLTGVRASAHEVLVELLGWGAGLGLAAAVSALFLTRGAQPPDEEG